jgi:hypothetical protein
VEDLDLGSAFHGGDLAGDVRALFEELQDGVVERVDARAGLTERGANGDGLRPFPCLAGGSPRPRPVRMGLHAGMVA